MFCFCCCCINSSLLTGASIPVTNSFTEPGMFDSNNEVAIASKCDVSNAYIFTETSQIWLKANSFSPLKFTVTICCSFRHSKWYTEISYSFFFSLLIVLKKDMEIVFQVRIKMLFSFWEKSSLNTRIQCLFFWLFLAHRKEQSPTWNFLKMWAEFIFILTVVAIADLIGFFSY